MVLGGNSHTIGAWEPLRAGGNTQLLTWNSSHGETDGARDGAAHREEMGEKYSAPLFFHPPFFPGSSSSLFFLLSASLSLSLIVVYYFHCMIFNKKRHKDALKAMDMLWLSVDSAVWGIKAAPLYP